MKKILNYIKVNKTTIILLSIIIISFIILSTLVLNHKIDSIDKLFYKYIFKIRNKDLTKIFSIITNIAGALFLIILSTLILILSKKKQIPLYIYINLISSWLINEIAKTIFQRSRPIGINLIEETGLSYPSGHSMVGLAYYGFISYILYKKTKKKSSKIIIILSLITIVSLIGFSRIYLGVHYLSDVIGGFLLSIIYLTIYIKCIKLEKK